MSVSSYGGSTNIMRSAHKGSANSINGTNTVLSLSGSGRLVWLTGYGNGVTLTVNVVVDGVTVVNGTTISSGFSGFIQALEPGAVNGWYNTMPLPIDIEFSQSLQIQLTSTTANSFVNWIYEI